jgi:hypothetical protein
VDIKRTKLGGVTHAESRGHAASLWRRIGPKRSHHTVLTSEVRVRTTQRTFLFGDLQFSVYGREKCKSIGRQAGLIRIEWEGEC